VLKDIFETFEVDLSDPEYAARLLNTSLEEETLDVFLVNLRDIVRARGGVAALAKSTGLGRESLYKTLSPGHSPEFQTVCTIVKALGLSLDFAPSEEKAA
jgi:probable addiction module antidote protein